MSTSMNRWILGLSLVSGAAFGATTTVDSWTDPGSATVSGAPGTNSATVDSAGVVGGERDQLVELLNGTGTLALSVAAGAVTISLDDMSSAGTAVLSYDGDDDDAVTLDPTGLGGIDLIDGTEGGLTLPLGTVSGTIDLIVEIHTDGANASEAFAILEACAGPCDPLVIGFERFTTLTGTGADFTNVGAIVFRFTLDDVESVQTNIALTTLAPAIAASNVDSPGTAAPDDDISYTVTIDNTAGGRADAVQFANTLDANVAQQGLIFTSPIAFPDQFETFGGLPLTVSAPGLLSNDVDPDGDDNANAADDVLVDVAPVTTDKGGTVTLNADGSFTYNAPPGFNGIDRFEYTVVDDDPGATNGPRMSSSQVHIKVAGSVIFVDKDAAGGGDGSLATPYNNLTDAQNNSLPSDIIYLFGGSPYTDGITLKNEQQLIGQGVDLRVGTTTLVVGGAATRPVIQTNGIALAQDNLLLGFDLANTTGPAIGGANFGTATIGGAAFANMVPVTDEVGVDSARILDLGTGTLAASFAALSTPAGPGPAAPTVRLTTVAGAATATTTTIAGSGADAIEISGSSATFDFGTTTIDGATLAAIDLSNNTGTFTFNKAMLGVATANGSGLVANGGGTVNFTGTNPTSIADGGPALFVDDSGAGTTVGQTGGAAGFTFTSLQSANAPTDGIVLDSVGSNLSVTGASTVNNATTNGIEISASTGTITFASIDIDGGVTGMLVSGSNVVTVQGGTIDGTTGDGINSVNTGLAVSNVTMGGSTIVGGDGIEVQNTDATSRLATVAGSTLTVSGRGLLTLSNGASTLTLALDTTGIVTTGNALAVDVSSASSGDTIVTSLNGNSVGGAASGGFSFDRVTFDADPGTAGIQTVSGGTTDIGTATNRVVNDGLELLCTTGNLSFADLDVFNTGGDGIEVNTKAGTCGTPTTFTLATTTGVVDTTSGTALNLDPLTTAMTLANVLATPGAGQSGVILDEVDGTVNITSGTITGNTADAFRVVGGTVGGTIGLAIGQLNNASLVSVSGGHATGTLTFQTGVIDASNGDGLQFDNADGSYNFNGTTTLNGGDAGIDITTGSAGTFTFGAGTAITNPTGRPYFESGSTANVTYNGTITQNNPNGLQITNKTGGTTDFNGAITANTSTGIGIDLVNNAGSTIRFDGLLDIDTTNGTGFNASGGGTVAGTGGGTVNSTNETAINFDGVTTDITFTSITSAGGGAPLGIDLTNLGANSTFNGGNTDTRAINIATVGAGADIDFATTAINGRTATGIFVRDVVGGTVDFGATTIPNPGGSAADGIRIRNSGAAVTFASTNISNTVQNITDNFDSVTGRPNTQGNGNGIMLIGNSGSVTINGGTIEDMVDNAVDIRNSDNTTLNGVMIVDGADGNSFSTANSAIMWHQGDNLTLNNVTIRNIGDDSPIPTGGVNVQDS
ncbi:MAG: Ig-like domain-containing protein, partial [Pseudomonadota bacterium]